MRLAIVGAGRVGQYLAVRLSRVAEVTLISRRPLDRDQLSAYDLRGAPIPSRHRLEVATSPDAARDHDAVLLAVRSQDTAEAAPALAPHLSPGTCVISMQNGLRNVRTIQASLPEARAIGGIVTFNVVPRAERGVQQTTSGPLVIGAGAESVVDCFLEAGQDARTVDDIGAFQAGKLLINLGNGLTAATGLSTPGLVANQEARLAFATCVQEGLDVFKVARQPVRSIGLLSPHLMAKLLPLPDPIVHRLARGMVKIDADAKSSTLMDLEAGRSTEIDFLNGEIVRIAEEHGADAPANRFVTEAVHAREAGTQSALSAADLLAGVSR